MSDLTVGSRQIVILNRDLFFGVRLKQLGTDLGYTVVITSDAATFLDTMNKDEPALGIIDINAEPDWALLAASTHAVPIIAFGPHLDVDGLRAAKAAGVTRVISNGQFHRDAAQLIERYAVRDQASGPESEDPEIANH